MSPSTSHKTGCAKIGNESQSSLSGTRAPSSEYTSPLANATEPQAIDQASASSSSKHLLGMEPDQYSLQSAAPGINVRDSEDDEEKVLSQGQIDLNAEFRKRHFIGSQSYQNIFCLPGNDNAQEESKEVYEDWIIKCDRYLSFFHKNYRKIVDEFINAKKKEIIKGGNDRKTSEEAVEEIMALVDKEVLKWQDWRQICETRLHQRNALN